MTITYDPNTDTLTVILKPGPVAGSDEAKPSVPLDYDKAGDLVSLEILDASKRMPDFDTIQFRVAV